MEPTKEGIVKEMSKEERDRWVAEHADQFENDCRPDRRETGVEIPPHLAKMVEARQAKVKAASEKPSEHLED